MGNRHALKRGKKEQNQLISVLGEGRTDDAGRIGAAAASHFVREAARRQVGETEDRSADKVNDAPCMLSSSDGTEGLSSIYYQFLSLQFPYLSTQL